jgi:hypothetical protein
MSCGELG